MITKDFIEGLKLAVDLKYLTQEEAKEWVELFLNAARNRSKDNPY